MNYCTIYLALTRFIPLRYDRYSIWIKKEKSHLEQLSDFLLQKESKLRRHPEFEEILEADLNALSDFKKTLGIKQRVTTDTSFGTADGDPSISVAATPSPSAASSRRGTSSALSKGSRTSRRSGMSTQSDLSPLYEEDDAQNKARDSDGEDDNESDASPTPQKRRRLDSYSKRSAESSSVGSSVTKSSNRRGAILEEKEQDNSDSE